MLTGRRIIFPVAAAAIVIWVAGEDMFVANEATQSGILVLVSAAIWGVLIGFSLLFILMGDMFLHRISKDSRRV